MYKSQKSIYHPKTHSSAIIYHEANTSYTWEIYWLLEWDIHNINYKTYCELYLSLEFLKFCYLQLILGQQYKISQGTVANDYTHF